VAWQERLEDLATEYGLPADAAARLERLLELVRDDAYAPTTVREPAVGVETHVADSLAGLALDVVRDARRLADLGSGAGFPGFPLATALPDADVALVESAGRKCAFLERVADAAGIANARVVPLRVEEWDERGLDVVCVRAVAPLAVLVEYAAPLLRIGGSLVAWKGAPPPTEVADARAAAATVGLEESERVSMRPRPGADTRTLYVYSKAHETPDGYPRRPGMAQKRPLKAST